MAIPLTQRRLIFVTGKGGVGKSTVALALGLAAAQRGIRTIVAELVPGDGFESTFTESPADVAAPPHAAHGPHAGTPRGPHAGTPRGPHAGTPHGPHASEHRLAPDLYCIAIDPQVVMEEYLKLKLPSPLASWLARSRLFGALSWATPGLRELLAIGKVWELAQPQRTISGAKPYELVIVDAPASGHGLATLRAPRTFAAIAKVGPVAHTGALIAATLADRDFTSIVAVTTAEEIPINETIELGRSLRADGLDLSTVIVNGVLPQRFSEQDDARLASVTEPRTAPSAGPRTEATVASSMPDVQLLDAIACARSEHRRAAAQAQQRARLGEELLAHTVELPQIYGPLLGRSVIDRLAEQLAEVIE